jgi:hypothetical protein
MNNIRHLLGVSIFYVKYNGNRRLINQPIDFISGLVPICLHIALKAVTLFSEETRCLTYSLVGKCDSVWLPG